jgi:tetratricopeptide (TPR) repeat protein
MGNLQAAINDAGRAIAILQTLEGAAAVLPGLGQAANAHATVASATVTLLTARGTLLEQAERHSASLADFEAALKLDAANAAAMLAAARLRKSLKGKPDGSITASQMNLAWRSVPRPGMQVFENRGKAGTAF